MTSGLKTEKENQNPLDQIILGIAHELNNPNAYIRMNLTNLKKMFWMLRPCLEEYAGNHPETSLGPYTLPKIQSKINQQLESALEATVRIITIADKLKQCTSDSLATSSVHSLSEVILDMLRAHRFLLDRCGSIEFDYSESESYPVSCYRLQLEQALSVLLTNACDAVVERYGEEAVESGRIDLTLSKGEERIVIRITDNGCGMSRETLDKVFTPYFTTKPQGQGDGLGMAICRSIIQRHDGSIEIKSEENQGTEVVIKLPIGEDEGWTDRK
jgi:signal transduction histidine kinase